MTAAIALFVFGAITAALSLQFPLGTLRAPGSGFFPLALGLLLMGLAAAHGRRSSVSRSPRPAAGRARPAANPPRRDGATRRVLLFMGAVVARHRAPRCRSATPLTSFLLMLGAAQGARRAAAGRRRRSIAAG